METNKYQEALDKLVDDSMYLEYRTVKERALIQELIDRDKEVFNHVLIVKDSRVHKRIAFHTQREALEFVQKYQIEKWGLDSARFYKESEYENK